MITISAFQNSCAATWPHPSSNFTIPVVYKWRVNDDVPVPGDFDGDGKLDQAVFRPSINAWFVLTSASGFTSALTPQWGLAGDIPILRRQ